MAASVKLRPVRLPPLPTIRDILRLYKLRAIKELSQNFLLDEKVSDKIVKAAGNISGGYVCEVGPGPGNITRSILRRSPSRLVVVEKDPRFVPTLDMLTEAVEGKVKFETIVGDILTTKLENIFPDVEKRSFTDERPNVHLIGNLPFSVSTILIIRWLEAISIKNSIWTYGRTRMTLTFQKEVAERIVAPILSKHRCRMSLMCQNWCAVEHKFNIKGRVFLPKPEVDVGVVTLTPLKKPVIPLDFKLIEKFLRIIFNTKRKYSLKSAKKLFPPHLREGLTLKMFENADVDPQIRVINLTIEEFKRLMYEYVKLMQEYPDIAKYEYRKEKNSSLEGIDLNIDDDDDEADDSEDD